MAKKSNARPPVIQWEGKIGPATIMTVIAMIVQLVVFIWVGSSYVTSNANKVDSLGTKIEEYKKGSDERFTTVRGAIKDSRDAQATLTTKLTSVETTLSFLGQQFQYIQSRIDGKPAGR